MFADTPVLPFLQNFSGVLFGCTLLLFWPNLKFVALPFPGIIAIGVLRTPIIGKRRPWSSDWNGTVGKSVGDFL